MSFWENYKNNIKPCEINEFMKELIKEKNNKVLNIARDLSKSNELPLLESFYENDNCINKNQNEIKLKENESLQKFNDSNFHNRKNIDNSIESINLHEINHKLNILDTKNEYQYGNKHNINNFRNIYNI